MSGHSKWATIKRKKARQTPSVVSSSRGWRARSPWRRAKAAAIPIQIFKLRLAVDKARGNNMPKDNIERAINRGTGDGEGGALEQILYEWIWQSRRSVDDRMCDRQPQPGCLRSSTHTDAHRRQPCRRWRRRLAVQPHRLLQLPSRR